MTPRIVLYNPGAIPGKKILPMSILALGAVLEGRYEYAASDGNLSADPLRHPRSAGRRQCCRRHRNARPAAVQAFPHCRALKEEFPGDRGLGGYFRHSTPPPA
jgi:hypothetical protein